MIRRSAVRFCNAQNYQTKMSPTWQINIYTHQKWSKTHNHKSGIQITWATRRFRQINAQQTNISMNIPIRTTSANVYTDNISTWFELGMFYGKFRHSLFQYFILLSRFLFKFFLIGSTVKLLFQIPMKLPLTIWIALLYFQYWKQMYYFWYHHEFLDKGYENRCR